VLNLVDFTYRISNGALQVLLHAVQSGAGCKTRHVDIARQVGAQSTRLSPSAGEACALRLGRRAVERWEGFRHGESSCKSAAAMFGRVVRLGEVDS
jgi:hypothetical protein